MLIVILCIVSAIILTVYAVVNTLSFYKPSMFLSDKPKKNLVTFVEEETPVSIFKSKKRIQIKDESFLNIQLAISTSFSVKESSTSELDSCLQELYLIHLKLKELKKLNYISIVEHETYQKIVTTLLHGKLSETLSDLRKGYDYSAENNLKKTKDTISRLNSFINNYKIPDEPPVKKVTIDTISGSISRDIILSSENDSVVMNSIRDKHTKLDNVISKSLYQNALNLNTSLKRKDLSETTVEEIQNQLNQINKFLTQELSIKVNKSEAEFVNDLKANQRYLDSLEINWTSENNIK